MPLPNVAFAGSTLAMATWMTRLRPIRERCRPLRNEVPPRTTRITLATLQGLQSSECVYYAPSARLRVVFRRILLLDTALPSLIWFRDHGRV